MEIDNKQDITSFVDTFFERYPSVEVNALDKGKIIHDLLAFGLDCIAIGMDEGLTAGQENMSEADVANKEWYGIVRWHPDDVIAAAEEKGIELTHEQAVEWWEKNEQAFIDRMTEEGNEILSHMDFE